jgi:hypothetical protein
MDKANRIRQDVYEHLLRASQDGGFLDGFQVWIEMPRTERVLYPCCVMTMSGPDVITEFYGGGTMRRVSVEVDVGIQEKKTAVPDDEQVLEFSRTVTLMGEQMRELLLATEFSPELNLGAVSYDFRPAASMLQDEDLIYGFTAILDVLYEDA